MDEITFLEQFVRIPSLSQHEEEAANYLVTQMTHLGFRAYLDDAGNAIGELGTHGPLVALLGHIDTVGGKVPVRYEDGKLYGRGTVDAKGPFATFVWAASRAMQTGNLPCRVVLIGAVEEEAATSKGANYAVDKYAPNYCIIGEPSGWNRITLGYKGRLLVHYHHEQPSAHSAGELISAPENAVLFWLAVQEYCKAHNVGKERLFEQLIPSLRLIASGGDGLHDWATSTIGLRLPEDVDPQALVTKIKALEVSSAPQIATTLTFEGACPAYRSPRATPLANAFVRAIKANQGTPGFLHKTGTSDMNVAGPAWKCPIVAYGPGDSSLDHTPDEHLVLAEYKQAIEVLTAVLLGLTV